MFNAPEAQCKIAILQDKRAGVRVKTEEGRKLTILVRDEEDV